MIHSRRSRSRLRPVLFGLALSLALVAPLDASAAVLEVSGSTMTYSAGPGEVNLPGVPEGGELRLAGGVYRFREGSSSPITVGPGCRQDGPRLYACEAAGVTQVSASLGDERDALALSPALPVGTRVRGGSAVDYLDYRGTPGVFVTLDGQANDGGSGQDDVGADIEQQFGSEAGDLLSGDASSELLVPGDGDDSAFGGAGNDRVVVAETDNGIDDGEDGDDSASGGAGNDRITAAQLPTEGVNGGVLYRSGVDRVSCGPGRDLAVIDDGDTGGRDCEVLGVLSDEGQVFRGSPGNDVINLVDQASGTKFSRGFGFDGDDVMRGSPAEADDPLSGGNGNDRIDARDGAGGDIVDCGPGTDTVFVDSGDVRRGCESVRR